MDQIDRPNSRVVRIENLSWLTLDRRHYLPVRVPALFGAVDSLLKLIHVLFTAQLHANPREQLGWTNGDRQRIVGPRSSPRVRSAKVP